MAPPVIHVEVGPKEHIYVLWNHFRLPWHRISEKHLILETENFIRHSVAPDPYYATHLWLYRTYFYRSPLLSARVDGPMANKKSYDSKIK